MNEAEKIITREELHRELWQTPLKKLAANWGVNVSGIKKAAQLMNVPRPELGYWRLVTLGKSAGRPELPPAGADTRQSATINPTLKRMVTSYQTSLSDDLRHLHPRVKAQYTAMKSAPVIERGPVQVEEGKFFDLWVSRGQLRRALLILDTVVKGLEAQGASFVVGNFHSKHLVAQFPAGTIAFRIAEKMEHEWVKIRQTPHGDGYILNHEWRYTPLGNLTFTILDYWPKETRKNWRDGVRQRLEDKAGEIIEQLCLYPRLAKQQQEQQAKECAERNRIWQEEYLRRTAPERLVKMVADLKEQIEKHGKGWEKAKAIRSFLAACEQVMRSDSAEPLPEWQTRWLGWGKAWVDGIDPMTNGFLSRLKHQFEELEELEAFVAELNEEKAKAAAGTPIPKT